MIENTKDFLDRQDIRRKQRSEEMQLKYCRDLNRLKNYMRVLVETKAFRPKSNNAHDRRLYNEIQDILPFIDKQISTTDHLIRLLEKLIYYDFGEMSIDEINRMKIRIPTDRLNSLLYDGALMNDDEKQLVILFINS